MSTFQPPSLPPPRQVKIYITQADNDQHFSQRLPTWRNGFCYITRKVTFIEDPDGAYDFGEYGQIKVNGQLVTVVGVKNEDGTLKQMELL